MFFFLSKLLISILMPVGILSLMLLYGIFTKNHTKRKKTLIFSFIFLYISCNPLIINKLMLLWEVPATPISQVAAHEVGIVLTGGISNEDKFPVENIYLGSCGDRIAQAVQLYKKGKIKKILVSGGRLNSIIFSPKQEATDAANYLIISGVRAEDIYLDTLSKNTRENAVNCSKILKKQFPNQKYLLITSSYHLKRATKCFEKVGIHVTPFGANYFTREPQFLISYIFPKEECFKYTNWLFHELIGYFTYWILGYL